MAYRLRYQVAVDWIPPGLGLGIAAQTQLEPGMSGGPAQTLMFFDLATPNSSTFTAADITAMLATLSTDISAQMNANIPRVQAFATGGG